METTIKKTGNGAIIWMGVLLILSQNIFAQSNESTRKSIFGLEDNAIGYIIIGSILGFGIVSYIIISIISKNSKNEASANNVKPINHHRHHHHHRIIKKSA